MQFVNEKWYTWYSRITVIFSLSLFVGSLLKIFVLQDFDPQNKWGLSYLTLVLASVHICYTVLLYKQIRKRSGAYVATLVDNFIFMANIVNLLQSTGQLHSQYEYLWMFTVFTTGIFGPYFIMAFCFLSILYLIIIMTRSPGIIDFETFDMVITGSIFAIGAASYLFWRSKYINQESEKIAALSGELKSSRLQTETLFRSISDAVIATDTEGRITHLNPSAATMTGWPVKEAVGIDVKLVIKFQHEDGKELDIKESPFQQVLTSGEQTTATLRLVDRKGDFKVVSLVASPIILPKSSDIQGIVAVLRDVSNARAEENRRADFISTASHEMRTPVAAIEGYLALALNNQVAQIDLKAREYLVKAHESTQHLGKLFQDLLTSAKAEDGRLVSHPQVVEMGSYLQEITDGLRFAAEKKGLLLDFAIGTTAQSKSISASDNRTIKPLYYVYIDPDRMREVINNIFDNAVKYTDNGKITIALTGDDQVVQMFIRDTGSGIPSEDVSHLFQKFYRVDNTATRTVGGTGLGLYISRKIVELYKGRIWVESQLGAGSTFFINLPRLSTAKAQELQNQEQPQATIPT